MGIAERLADSGGHAAARRIRRFDRARRGTGEASRVARGPDYRIRSSDRGAAPLFLGSRRKPAALAWRTEASRRSARPPDQSAAELQAKIAAFREQSEALSKEAGALRDSLAGVRARHTTLTQILNDRSYTADAVQKLFAANERSGGKDFHAVGVLADYAEVEERHEAAIEQYLRDELEYVVVETYDHARAGVSLLRDEVGGRATFFVDSLRNLRLSSEYEPIVNFRAEDGVISRLDKLVEFRDP